MKHVTLPLGLLVYDNPDIAANKRLLVNALDIIVSRQNPENNRSNSHESAFSLTPSRDLTDIQILARMQEDSLRQSTLQRTRTKNRKKSTPTETSLDSTFDSQVLNGDYRHVSNGERQIGSVHMTDNQVVYNGQHVEHENELGENFRSRNYAHQGTFRVKKKTYDNIQRPNIEAGQRNRQLFSNCEDDEEFERTEHSVLSECSSNTNSSTLSDLVAANSRMINDARLDETGIDRTTSHISSHQRPVIKPRGNNNPIARPSNINYSAGLSATATQPKILVPTTVRGGGGGDGGNPQSNLTAQKARNRSIPRLRTTGIPVMSSSNSHHSAISNSAANQSGANRAAQSRASMAASRSISPRQRNSSATTLSAVPVPKRSYIVRPSEGPISANRKLQLPGSSSSNSLKQARSSGRIDTMSVASSDYGLDDEFY